MRSFNPKLCMEAKPKREDDSIQEITRKNVNI